MNPRPHPTPVVGRAAVVNPPNRFERLIVEFDGEQLAHDDELFAPARRIPTQFFADDSQTLITHNDSPDIPFRHSMNPYRGCEHGCAYCYARPGHEYLGWNAGLDFESRILVKLKGAALLRRELAARTWLPEVIALSGVTDCYQPAERHFKLTRSLLEVLLESRQPCGIVTKNALVARDLDLLAEMARHRLVCVNISVTTLDAELARRLEPRTSTPLARLRTISDLAAAEIPVRAMIAPILPGLTDHEIPSLLKAVREHGASAASYQLVRLPWAVLPVFTSWLAANYPEKQSRVLALVRGVREGKLNSAEFGKRMCGAGEYAAQIKRTFEVFAAKLGLSRSLPPLDASQFRAPRQNDGQLRLF